MIALDREERADRLLGSMRAVEDLLSGRAPDLTLDATPLAYLFGLINQEAKDLLTPRAPGPRGLNDNHDID